MASNSNQVFKSLITIDAQLSNVKWYNGESIRSELVKVKGINVAWRFIFFPRYKPIDVGDYYSTFPPTKRPKLKPHTLVKIIIEDKSNVMLEYNCRFNCEGGLTFNWNPEFSNLDGIVTHDSSLSQTTKLIEKVLEVGSNKGLFHISVPDTQIIGDFKLKFELVLKPTSKIPKKLYSGPEMCSSGSDSEPEYIKQRSAPTVIVPTSARSSAFVSSIRKLNAESKINGQQDLIEIASKLLETANEFNLPDMKEISTDFLDFQITNANFADILKIAVDQKNDTLLNFTTDYITVNQKELRSTEQWTKMMTSQLLISSIMEKLFIEKDFSDSFF